MKLGIGAVGLFMFILASFGSTSEPPETTSIQGQQPTVRVQIQLSGNTAIAVPDSVYVRRGQRIEWMCATGSWTVHFHAADPFGRGPVDHGISGAAGQWNGTRALPAAPLGKYLYDVSCTRGDEIIEGDPEVVIGPGRREEQAPR